MAGIFFTVNSGSIAAPAGSARTILQIAAPANQRVKITSVGIYFDGVTATNAPAGVRILRQTTAGTGGSTVTPRPLEKELTETIQSTALANTSSVEPTAGDVLKDVMVPQYMGAYEFCLPFAQEYVIQGGGRLGVEVNSAQAVNVRVTIQAEE